MVIVYLPVHFHSTVYSTLAQRTLATILWEIIVKLNSTVRRWQWLYRAVFFVQIVKFKRVFVSIRFFKMSPSIRGWAGGWLLRSVTVAAASWITERGLILARFLQLTESWLADFLFKSAGAKRLSRLHTVILDDTARALISVIRCYMWWCR
jgi:hypothetical protein